MFTLIKAPNISCIFPVVPDFIIIVFFNMPEAVPVHCPDLPADSSFCFRAPLDIMDRSPGIIIIFMFVWSHDIPAFNLSPLMVSYLCPSQSKYVIIPAIRTGAVRCCNFCRLNSHRLVSLFKNIRRARIKFAVYVFDYKVTLCDNMPR